MKQLMVSVSVATYYFLFLLPVFKNKISTKIRSFIFVLLSQLDFNIMNACYFWHSFFLWNSLVVKDCRLYIGCSKSIGPIFINMMPPSLWAEQTPIHCNYGDTDAYRVILQWVYFSIYMPSRHSKNSFLFGAVPVFWFSCSLLQGRVICSKRFGLQCLSKYLIQSVHGVSARKWACLPYESAFCQDK